MSDDELDDFLRRGQAAQRAVDAAVNRTGPQIVLTSEQLLEQVYAAHTDRLQPADEARLRAIDAAVADQDRAAIVAQVKDYYRDFDRANRTPRALLYLHIGYLIGLEKGA